MSLLTRVSNAMQKIAPLTLAETSWDNVGILLEHPNQRISKASVYSAKTGSNTVMLAIDLTDKVLDECVSNQVSVLVAYHPPIFSSMKRLTMSDSKQSLILQCIVHGISIYSPHTALDACQDGINDWLARGLSKPEEQEVVPIKASVDPPVGQEASGQGRLVTLKQSVTFETLVQRVKTHLSLKHVRVAQAGNDIKTIAICAGSGASLLKGVKADAYLSGEMGHHDVLAANAKNVSVILCEHTNTERGYLKTVLLLKLQEQLGGDTKILISAEDKDPLTVM